MNYQTECARTRKFAIGDRVVALKGTPWDDDLDGLSDGEVSWLKLYGHHGRVVECTGQYGALCERPVHVIWTGVHDGRNPRLTIWTDGSAWPMSEDEIEHAD